MFPSSRQRLVVASTLLSFVLVACGGGGGGSAAPAPTGGTNPPPTTKVTYVTGSISGFGSVIVNGVRYESDSATVTKEGKSATQNDLKAGEVITLRAETGSDGVPHAKAIEQSRLAQGPVTAIDAAAQTLTIAGIVIQVTGETLFDPAITGGFAGIAVGDRIEVHGFAGANGTAVASRIEKADVGDNEIEVTGKVSALDTTAKKFTVGTQAVDYTSATLVGLPAAGLADGQLVEVKGTIILANGALQATRVEAEDGGLRGSSGDSGELRGSITRFVSPTDFDVQGQKVTTDSSTVYVGGTSADLKADAQVEVEGTLDANKVLVAKKIMFKREANFEVKAAVDAVTVADATSGTVTVLGITFAVNADTRKEDDVAKNHFFSLSDVRVGDWLEVAAIPDPADATKWVATKIEKVNAGTRTEISGTAAQLASPNFSIGGVAIATTNTTSFRNGNTTITSTDFFALTGTLQVEVEGTWNGTAPLIATKVVVKTPESAH